MIFYTLEMLPSYKKFRAKREIRILNFRKCINFSVNFSFFNTRQRNFIPYFYFKLFRN